jgi:hypothetical protein
MSRQLIGVQERRVRVIIGREAPRRMRNPFRVRPKPFLDTARREWQFDTFGWLLRNCGGYPKFLDTDLVLPVDAHYPRKVSGHAGVAALFRRVRDQAGMSEWPCTVEPWSPQPRSAAGSPDNVPVISYPPESIEPISLVATFALELARYLIETFEEPPPGGAALLEPAIEIAAVFMGFGLFMANAQYRGASHQLNEGEFVHALAMFCLLRKMQTESVEGHLNPHLRKYLRLASLDLAQHDRSFQRLRSVFAVYPVDVAERTLPTR